MIKRPLYLLASFCVTVAIIGYLLQFVSLRDVVRVIKDVDQQALLAFMALSLCGTMFRTWRYLVLLEASGHFPSRISLFLVVLVGNFCADILPGRLGSLVYIFLVTKRLNLPIGAAGSSFGLAFIFDLLALVPLILGAALLAGSSASIGGFGLLLGAAAIFMIWMLLYQFLGYTLQRFAVLCELVPLRAKARETVVHTLRSIATEVGHAKKGGIALKVFLLSLIVRLAKYGSLYIFLYALLHPIGYSWSELPIPKVFLGLLASEMAASLPISGIAGIGAYQGAWVLTFELLGFDPGMAKLTSFAHHLFTQAWGYSLGISALILLLVTFPNKLPDPPQFQKCTLGNFLLRYAGACGMVTLLISTILSAQLNQDGGKTEIKAQPTAPKVELSEKLPAAILFDSNRSGNFGLYILRQSGETVTLIDSKYHEMYPDPSPDGATITYSRSLSTARNAPSEIWIVNIDGLNPRKLVENGTFPTFSSDGKKIFFERERARVMSVNIDGSGVTQLFPAPGEDFGGYEVVKPRISPDQTAVLFTSNRKGTWNAWMADLTTGKARRLESGCEPTWLPDGKELAWIKESGAHGGSGIYMRSVDGLDIKPLFDRNVPLAHEYFPSIYPDTALFAACSDKEHSHLDANYELFALDLKSGVATQLTENTYTDRWPKLLLESKRLEN